MHWKVLLAEVNVHAVWSAVFTLGRNINSALVSKFFMTRSASAELRAGELQ